MSRSPHIYESEAGGCWQVAPEQGPEAQSREAPEGHRSGKTPWKAYIRIGSRRQGHANGPKCN